jgi:hypothetical protein
MGWRGTPGPNLRLRSLPKPRDGDTMEGAIPFEVASELVLSALCGIGFLAWITRDVTANIAGLIGLGHGHAD